MHSLGWLRCSVLNLYINIQVKCFSNILNKTFSTNYCVCFWLGRCGSSLSLWLAACYLLITQPTINRTTLKTCFITSDGTSSTLSAVTRGKRIETCVQAKHLNTENCCPPRKAYSVSFQWSAATARSSSSRKLRGLLCQLQCFRQELNDFLLLSLLKESWLVKENRRSLCTNWKWFPLFQLSKINDQAFGVETFAIQCCKRSA